MSGRGREIAILELHGRALYDIAQVLESAEGAEQRVLRALEMLRQLVPYEQCALLEAETAVEPLACCWPGGVPCGLPAAAVNVQAADPRATVTAMAIRNPE